MPDTLDKETLSLLTEELSTLRRWKLIRTEDDTDMDVRPTGPWIERAELQRVLSRYGIKFQ